MTYTIKQIERAHARVHVLAAVPSTDKAVQDAHAQRVYVMDDLLARMFVYAKKTLDRDALEPNVVTLIDFLLREPT